jgi:hypothetical protein
MAHLGPSTVLPASALLFSRVHRIDKENSIFHRFHIVRFLRSTFASSARLMQVAFETANSSKENRCMELVLTFPVVVFLLLEGAGYQCWHLRHQTSNGIIAPVHGFPGLVGEQLAGTPVDP